MKKTNFLKITMSVIMVLVVTIAFAQQKDGNLTIDNTVDHTVTVGKAIPFYVTPDTYFNPNYNSGGGWTVSSTFLWNSDGTLAGTSNPGTDATYSSTSVINPDITFPVTGSYVIGAQETSADGCPGTIQLQNVIVIAVPTTDFGGRGDVELCGDQTGVDVLFDITDNTATDFWVDWTYDVDELEADKTTLIDELDGTGPSTDNLDATNSDDLYAAAGTGLVLVNQNFTAIRGHVTRYTFTLTGINDAISRASDYVSSGRVWPVTSFVDHAPGADATFVYTVLPAPTTGPIYHLDI